MSSPLAIAGITQVLKDLLNDGLINHDITNFTGTTVNVTSVPPDRIDLTAEPTLLNIFMYQTTYNQGWRNDSLPSLNSRGERVNNPPLALDLHYLLTAYGGGVELHSEILLGYAMQLMHENPVLMRDSIRIALAPPSTGIEVSDFPLSLRAFATSGLADQVEQIKITPETMNTDDLSKLWTAFGAKYRPTAAYKVTVVLIESVRSLKPSLPVQERKIYVRPFNQPVIDKIKSQSGPGAPFIENQKILPGYRLALEGQNLQNDLVEINVEGVIVLPDEVNNTRVVFTLPSELYAGVQGVQVVQELLMGSPPVPHKGIYSNAGAFILSPEIKTLQVLNPAGSPGSRSADIKIALKPFVSQKQRIVLFLNEFIPGDAETALSYSFQLDEIPFASPPGDVDTVTIQINNVKSGIYLARIQVDGAESKLGIDSLGRYNAPQITL